MSHLAVIPAVSCVTSGVTASQIACPVVSTVSQVSGGFVAHNALLFGLQYIEQLALSQGVKVIQKSRRLKNYHFHPLTNDDLRGMESRTCSSVLICSFPLSGISGLTNAGRHFVAIFISANGVKQDRFLHRQLFHFTAYAFEFGSACGATMEGPGEICISAFNMSIESRHRKNVAAYARELERHGFKVEACRPCRATLRNALLVAVVAGKRNYTLRSYNCKAYSRTVFDSIGGSTVQFAFDDGNDTFMKYVASCLLPASSLK